MAFKNYDKEAKGEIPSSLLGTVMKNLGYNLVIQHKAIHRTLLLSCI